MLNISVLWRDVKARALTIQILIVIFGLLAAYFALSNAITNLQNLGVQFGFGFLDNLAGYDISFSLLPFDFSSSTHFDALIIGILNTLLVSIIGIVLASIIGLTVGLMRLSKNVLISTVSSAFIEIERNVPLLLHILFWYFGAWVALPSIRQGAEITAFNPFDLGLVYIHNRGINLPSVDFGGQGWLLALAFVLVIICIFILRRISIRRKAETGHGFPLMMSAIACIIIIPVATWMLFGLEAQWSIPTPGRFNFSGGIEIVGSFFALLIALSLYAGAFIAENVRSGILAVKKGQVEAAQALGLQPGEIVSKVVMPQAMRVIIPPVTNHYLNLVKNSSLAVAIGYPELVNIFVGSTLNLTGQSVEVILLTMTVYLIISLTISLFMNKYNNLMALKER